MRADSLEGPWSQPFFVAPAYTRTFSTQSGFSWRIDGSRKTTYLYMGDQASSLYYASQNPSPLILDLVGPEFTLGKSERVASYRD